MRDIIALASITVIALSGGYLSNHVPEKYREYISYATGLLVGYVLGNL